MKRSTLAGLGALALHSCAAPALAGQVPDPMNAPSSVTSGDLVSATAPQQAADSGLPAASAGQNKVVAGPCSGGPGALSERTLCAGDLTSALASPPAIGATTPAAGSFTGLSATGAIVSTASSGDAFSGAGGYAVDFLGTIETASTETPTLGPGTLAIYGAGGAPTFNASHTGAIYTSAAEGLILAGRGSSCDVTLAAANSTQIFCGAHNSANATFFGTVQAAGSILTAAPPTASSGQIGYGGATAAASACGSLAGAAGCVEVNVGGTLHYIPYF